MVNLGRYSGLYYDTIWYIKIIKITWCGKSIEEINEYDNKKKEKEIENKKIIEDKLIKKYKGQRRNKYESEPLKKNSVIVEVKSKKRDNLKTVNEEFELEKDIIDDNVITKEELINEYLENDHHEKNINKNVNNDLNKKKSRTRKKKKKKN